MLAEFVSGAVAALGFGASNVFGKIAFAAVRLSAQAITLSNIGN